MLLGSNCYISRTLTPPPHGLLIVFMYLKLPKSVDCNQLDESSNYVITSRLHKNNPARYRGSPVQECFFCHVFCPCLFIPLMASLLCLLDPYYPHPTLAPRLQSCPSICQGRANAASSARLGSLSKQFRLSKAQRRHRSASAPARRTWIFFFLSHRRCNHVLCYLSRSHSRFL